jgi:hypothetical protein
MKIDSPVGVRPHDALHGDAVQHGDNEYHRADQTPRAARAHARNSIRHRGLEPDLGRSCLSTEARHIAALVVRKADGTADVPAW